MVADRMVRQLRQLFPDGTPVILREQARTGRGLFVSSESVGTVVGWRYEGTAAWYAENGSRKIPNRGGHLQLLRLRLKKIDGEIVDIIIDDLASIAKLEAL